MTLDPELDTWRHQWQARDAMPADVRRRVERDLRSMRLGFLSAAAVTVIFGGGTTAWALDSGDPGIAVVAVATWVFIAVTWAVSLTIEGGVGRWRPASTTTAAFLEFSTARRVAARRGIVAAAVLYAAFSAFMLVWRFQNPAGAATTDVWSYLVGRWMFCAITAVLAVVAIWRWRALGRELDVLSDLRRNQ
ncbi:MAG: hypothetical protein R2712_00020 [Vicinamibacterales bacterium]